jgi:hypothetical protein
MKQDQFAPALSYSYALEMVQFINTKFPSRHLPVNVTEIMGYISDYQTANRDGQMSYQKISFHEFLYAHIHRRASAPVIIGEPRPGLIEFYLIGWNANSVALMFPADLNSGWQSAEYKIVLESRTIFRGYAKDRQDAIRLRDALVLVNQR